MSVTPNILFLLSDQHRADAMGCAGHPFLKTPALDSLAREGVIFENAYSSNPLCVPARMGLMTGRHCGDIRVWGNGNVLDSTIPTFAHGLGAAGYETVLCGKMHFCGPDQFHGFKQRLVGECHGGLFPSNLRTSDTGEQWSGSNRYAVTQSGVGHLGFQYFDRRVADESAAFIRQRRENEQPWCLVAGFISPHNPFVCDSDWYHLYHPQTSVPTREEIAAVAKAQPYLEFFRKNYGLAELSPEEHRRARAAYFGLCSELDANIARVLNALHEQESERPTIIVCASDHGEMAGDAGLWFKTNLTESSVKVPLIISCPALFPKDRTVKHNVSLLDISATLLDLAGAPPLPFANGVSLRPTLEGSPQPPHDENLVWAESLGTKGCRHIFALWKERWKYVLVPELKHEHLFDLETDPHESKDLSALPEHQSRLGQLRELARKQWSYESASSGLREYNERIHYVRQCGHEWMPHEMPHLKFSPEWSQFGSHER